MGEAEKDIFLTAQALRLGRAMADGSLQPSDKRNNEVPQIAKAPVILDPLALSATPGDALLALAPQTTLYKGLVDALAKARQQATLPPWVKVPSSGKLSPGDDAAEVAFLRQRLATSGDYQGDETAMASTVYDPVLEEAVKAFQANHSLDVDGVVGVGTRAALNISAAERVDQIKINLDRLRRLPDDLGKRHLLVNVAGFEAWLYQDGQVIFDTPIIVGKSQNQTPTFSDTIRSVEFNPSWEVPRSIGLKEILPALAKDPTYLDSKNMEVYEGWEDGGMLIDPSTVDWVSLAQNRRLPYRFRQRPGAGNSLGQVKLLFPNKHDVYLHDTPSRGLFRRGQRAFSHGCMRVGKPLELAGEVLGMDQDAINSVLGKGAKTRLLVRNPMPIHITYLTAWIDPTSGALRYAADIYSRDTELMAQLHPVGMTAETDPDPTLDGAATPIITPASIPPHDTTLTSLDN
jgi:murein L,D-transpeptidase YcbB/YkuD